MQKPMTKSQFISHTYRGGQVTLEADDGFHTVSRTKAGYYAVDGKGNHTLTGICTWFGAYHAQYGEAVFFPKR